MADSLQRLIEKGEAGAVLNHLSDFEPEARLSALGSLSPALQKQALTLLGVSQLARLLRDNKPQRISDFLASFASDDLADILGELNLKLCQQVIDGLPSLIRDRARRLLTYGKDTAGGRMAEEFVAFPMGCTLRDVVASLQRSSLDAARAFYIYVNDMDGRLVGVLMMRDLVLKDPLLKVDDVMRRNVITVTTKTDQEQVAKIFQQKRLLALPVVDESQKLLGVITQDDVAEIIRQEASEDMLKLGGIPDGIETFDEPLRRSLRRRLPWLMVNLLLDMVAVSIVAYYEGTIAAVVALAVVLPIISDMGGNTGIQTLSVMIRTATLGRMDINQFWRIFRRESVIGFLNGCILGCSLAIAAYFWKGLPYLGLVAGTAIFINTYIAGLAGALLPLILGRFRLDPASSAGPLLTTITDLTGFYITLKLATYFIVHLTPA